MTVYSLFAARGLGMSDHLAYANAENIRNSASRIQNSANKKRKSSKNGWQRHFRETGFRREYRTHLCYAFYFSGRVEMDRCVSHCVAKRRLQYRAEVYKIE